MSSLSEANHSQDCPNYSTVQAGVCTISVELTNSLFYYLTSLQVASGTLMGKGYPSDIAQDIIGFRALINGTDPYPKLGEAFPEIGLNWDVEHESTHPPMAFLFVAPIAFLPWNIASMIWAWLMLLLITFTLRCFGVSWKAAIGLTPVVLLWPPVANSLGQFTIIWLFALSVGYHNEWKQQFWRGIPIGVVSLMKLLPGIMVGSFLLKKQWRSLIGFLSTWVASLSLILLIAPGSIYRYIEVNRINSLDMILRHDNSSLLINSYRFGGWIGVSLILLLFILIIFTRREYLIRPKLFTSPVLWIMLSYFSVVLLPVSWIYSITPLLPIIIFLISQKKLSTMTVGFCSIIIPCIIPPYGSSSAPLLALVILLVGLGILFDGLPYRLFNSVYLADLIRPSKNRQ